jgi:hypothetical protein
MHLTAQRRILQLAGLLAVIALLILVSGRIERQTGSKSTQMSTNMATNPVEISGLPVTGQPIGGTHIFLPFVSDPAVPAIQPTPGRLTSDPVLVGAGDIARCGVSGDEATAALIKKIPGTVMAIGDTAYSSGTASQFSSCYDPSWGAFKDRTRPAPGNHEYMTGKASPYYNYFGAAAGPAGKGYYSYDLGSWHIVVLNSECSNLSGGCAAGSEQETWLKQDLKANPQKCSLAYWHEPLYSSGEHGNNSGMKTLWQDLYAAGAELVFNGHDHDYERFAPLNGNGSPDPANGIREIVVGTGGGNLRPFGKAVANSEVRIANSYGVIKVSLQEGSYHWEFIKADGSIGDSGSANCH